MRRPRAVLVDLDNTLLDFDRAERLALRAALVRLGFSYSVATLEEYRRINSVLWARYSRGEMKGSAVARERFVQLLEKIGGDVRLAPALGELYLAYLSRRGDTLPGARSALARLGRRFPIAVVTNGYERVQRSRLRAGRLAGYFEAVVTSEACGYAKPHPGIVRVALDALGVEPQEAVYVGDDAHTDGGAAHAAGVPFYWLDRGVPAPAGTRKPRYSISSLGELADSLGC